MASHGKMENVDDNNNDDDIIYDKAPLQRIILFISEAKLSDRVFPFF